MPFITAHRCLTVTEEGPDRLGPGTLTDRVVLVAGGAGAVGNAAIQLARWSDATVIATVSSPEKAHLAAEAGADHVINYKQEDVAPRFVGSRSAASTRSSRCRLPSTHRSTPRCLARLGSVAVYANNGGNEMTIPIRPLMGPNARWQFVLLYTAPAEAKGRAVEDISAALLDGAVRIGEEAGLPIHHFPLDQTAQAHAAVEDSIVGKVLIDVSDG